METPAGYGVVLVTASNMQEVRQRGLLPKGEASAKGVSPMSDCEPGGQKQLQMLLWKLNLLHV
ncbi:hypothetical protein [Nostoc sp.]|uniref:hypothetical protein n=1 Tax=Nostoc sp. TaxID=1180 RepID=UPI002FF681A9